MGLKEHTKRKITSTEALAPVIILVILGVTTGATLLGTYLIAKPVGEGIGQAFTLFGNQISLYVVIGLVIVAVVLLWFIFGKKE